MDSKEIKKYKALIGISAGVLALAAVFVLILIINPGLVKSVAFNFPWFTARASKDPSAANQYIVKGTSDNATILVKFKNSASDTRIGKINQTNKTKVKRSISGIKTKVLTLPANASVGQIVDTYKNLPEVEYAEPNYLASAFLTPNDPLYSTQ